MKLLMLSDVHATSKNPIARTDNVMGTFFKKFTYVLEYAQKHKMPILQAGDFFDKPRDWYLLFRMMHLIKKYKVPIYSIFGQHDSYLYSNITKTPTTLSILNRVGLIKILWNKPINFDKGAVKVYGCSWKKAVPTPDPDCPCNILVIHAPISPYPLFRGHRFLNVIKFAKQYKGYKLILVGDVHRQFHYIDKGGNQMVVNTGPMLRLDAIEYNSTHHPSAFVYDTKIDVVHKISIPHKDHTKVLDFSHLSKAIYTQRARTEWIHSVKTAKLITIEIKESILNAIRKNPISRRAKEILMEVMEKDGS